MIDLLDVVGDALRLGEKLLRALDRLLQLQQRRKRQRCKIFRLIDQHPGLILQGYDLVVDLLQSSSGGEDALRVVIGIEDDQLRCCRAECGEGDRWTIGWGSSPSPRRAQARPT